MPNKSCPKSYTTFGHLYTELEKKKKKREDTCYKNIGVDCWTTIQGWNDSRRDISNVFRRLVNESTAVISHAVSTTPETHFEWFNIIYILIFLILIVECEKKNKKHKRDPGSGL